MNKFDVVYLNHISDSIVRIEKFMGGYNEKEFKNSELIQSAVIRQIEIIDKSTKNISEEIRNKYQNVLWKDISGYEK